MKERNIALEKPKEKNHFSIKCSKWRENLSMCFKVSGVTKTQTPLNLNSFQ